MPQPVEPFQHPQIPEPLLPEVPPRPARRPVATMMDEPEQEPKVAKPGQAHKDAETPSGTKPGQEFVTGYLDLPPNHPSAHCIYRPFQPNGPAHKDPLPHKTPVPPL